jgi:phospholipase C
LRKTGAAFALTVLSISLLTGLCPGQNPLPSPVPRVRAQGVTTLQHFVFIIKENRSFDHYFGTFPGADGATSGTISTGQVIPLSHASDRLPRDIGHSWSNAMVSMDSGRMDGFDLITGGAGSCNINGDYLCYSQLHQSDIPNYFAYASKFVLADHMFSSIHGNSFSNHLFTVAAQSGGAFDNPANANLFWGCDAAAAVRVSVLDDEGNITKQYPCFDFQTLADSVQNAGMSWRYYAPGAGDLGYEYSALDAIDHIRNGPLWTANVVPDTQFVTDAKNGNLPAVSWVVTNDPYTEHSTYSTCQGENWTVKQVNAIMQGPDWDSTAVFVTWDDFGGFYDHLPPPQADDFGFGPRVPLLIISPYVIPGYISHTEYEFSSFLKLVEDRFGLASLTTRDANANDMLDSFDFTQPPAEPYILPARNCSPVSNTELNFPLQAVGKASSVKTLKVSNYGPSTLTISSIKLQGAGFSQTNTCTKALPPPSPTFPAPSSCTVSMTFQPTSTGPLTGTITFTDTDVTSPQVVSLSGIGTSVALSPVLLNFGTAWVGQTSKSLAATLTNNGSSSLTISRIVASGSYTQTNTCGTLLGPSASCTLTVKFIPTAAGTQYGTVTITDSDRGSPQVLNLTGVSKDINLNPAQLNFGNQKVGTTSAPLTFTLTNRSKAALNISRVAFEGSMNQTIFDYAQSNTCAGTVAAGKSCVFSVTFSPRAVGSRPGTIFVFDSESATSPQAVTLTGTGT